MFISCWVQPGFNRFWRLWNPLYGFFLFQFYCLLGGARRPLIATLSVFMFCGYALHDLPVALLRGQTSIVGTVAFLFYGVVTLVSRISCSRLRFASWPRWLHALVNPAFVLAGLFAGVWVQRQLLA